MVRITHVSDKPRKPGPNLAGWSGRPGAACVFCGGLAVILHPFDAGKPTFALLRNAYPVLTSDLVRLAIGLQILHLWLQLLQNRLFRHPWSLSGWVQYQANLSIGVTSRPTFPIENPSGKLGDSSTDSSIRKVVSIRTQ